MSDTKQIDDGGPAFPCDVQVEDNSGSHYEERSGLSLRDWFAGQALAGLMAKDGLINPSREAYTCYNVADAMLAARKEKQ